MQVLLRFEPGNFFAFFKSIIWRFGKRRVEPGRQSLRGSNPLPLAVAGCAHPIVGLEKSYAPVAYPTTWSDELGCADALRSDEQSHAQIR